MESTPPPPPRVDAHEFGPHENQVIGQAGKWIGYWSWIAILSGGLMAVGSLLNAEGRVGGLVMGAVYVFVGTYFRGAAAAMKDAVSTEGNDVAHLMTALDKLSSAFKVMVLLVFVGVVLGLVAAIVSGITVTP